MDNWNKLFLGIIVIVTASLPLATSSTSHYCWQRRQRIESYQVQRWRSCGWFGWSRCCYYETRYRTVNYNVRVCCPGWKGCYCHIPICNPPCAANRGKCVAPNKCECYSVAYRGPTCNVVTCSYRTDCYPGKCIQNPTPSLNPLCVCHNGFNGTNCEEMNVGPEIESCSANLQNWYQGKLRNQIDIQCNLDDVTTRDRATKVYVNDRDQKLLNLKWKFKFAEPQNPPSRPNYVTKYDVGLVDSKVTLDLRNDINSRRAFYNYTCSQANRDVPPASVACEKNHTVQDGVGENYRYIISFEAKSGGFKTVVNSDHSPVKYDKKLYSELGFSKEVHIIYDVEKPFHCTRYDNCPPGEYDRAIPFGLSDDIAKTNVTFIIFGWNDSLSGIERFEYNSMKMAPDYHGLLYEYSISLSSQTWRYGDGPQGIPIYQPKEPGMYSIYLSVYDVANNAAHARSLLLYDNVTKVTTNPDYPMYIPSASPESNYTWMTSQNTSTGAEVTVTWEKHFWNKFHYENGLLNRVRRANDNRTLVSKLLGDKLDIIDDTYGNRTTEPIPNSRGIVAFKVAAKKALHMNNLEHVPPQTPMDLDIQNYTVEYQTVNDGETVKFWVTATDVMQNKLTETVMVSIDNSEPEIDKITQEINVPVEENPDVPYASRVTVKAWDYDSGIMWVNFTLLDQSDGGVEVYQGVAVSSKATDIKDHNDCARNSHRCIYCIPKRDCFDNNNKIYVDHCKILEQREGHSFSLDIVVVNQASKASVTSHDIGVMTDLQGIKYYPGVKNPDVSNATTTSVRLSWGYHPACYDQEGVRIFFEGSVGSHMVKYPSTTYTINNLKPGSKLNIQLTVVYQTPSGQQLSKPSALKAETRTPGSGGLSGGAIAGIIIGVLVVLALIVGLTLLWRRKGGRVPDFHQARAPQPPPSVQHLECANNVYLEGKGDNMKVMNAKLSNPTYGKDNKAYWNDDDDEIYVYDQMEVAGNNVKTLRPNEVQYGDIIKTGKFAVIRFATVEEKRRNKVTVAAKMLKDNATEGDRMLMRAKKNFYAKMIQPNDYILNLHGVIVEEGPVLLLEYCERGSLKDWLEQQPKLTTDIIDTMTVLCLHVANGMAHLHSLDVAHRRLAARNVLLTEIAGELHAKVAGFGPLPGDKFEQEHMKENAIKESRVPVKWLAPELLAVTRESERCYTKQSDVWAYGVVAWEVFSKGSTPYDLKTRHELHQHLLNGHRLRHPEGASEELYNDLMLKCWADQPLSRPQMEDVAAYLHQMLYQAADDEYYAER